MAAASKAQIDQETRDKVNRIDQRVEEVVLPTLEALQTQLTKLSAVSVAEYADNKKRTDDRLAKLEKRMDGTDRAVKFFNLLDSRWTNILIGALILGAIIAVATQASKLGINLG